jgi:hypothetical protein
MAWKQQGNKKDRYLRFMVGTSWEGIYTGAKERPNPFKDGEITDYYLTIDGEEKILSSTSGILKENLFPLPQDTEVRIECCQAKGNKFYKVFIQE